MVVGKAKWLKNKKKKSLTHFKTIPQAAGKETQGLGGKEVKR